ncbi:hypothetical protein E4T80_09895 [Muribacter muris]|uniref:Uncharacterized protein n=1 Tax=Muribacter muris TaxID=67855 RepID=A0A4Y9JTE3_9PAST|nr:hypothetical protein [Muribacter muris]MBF0785770.1 hypothetical protein [Muribacter muris]MBF0828258.1 hypothetical protein [Muribacter muris]TFV08592.1 hypothetical protein E4T80_09895 [Muribacter muris]
MKQQDQPKWRQIYQPSSREELIELRAMLSQHDRFSFCLEAFLCAEVQVMNAKARIELDTELRSDYQHAAHTLTELLGKLFAPQPQPTTESPRL